MINKVVPGPHIYSLFMERMSIFLVMDAEPLTSELNPHVYYSTHSRAQSWLNA